MALIIGTPMANVIKRNAQKECLFVFNDSGRKALGVFITGLFRGRMGCVSIYDGIEESWLKDVRV